MERPTAERGTPWGSTSTSRMANAARQSTKNSASKCCPVEAQCACRAHNTFVFACFTSRLCNRLPILSRATLPLREFTHINPRCRYRFLFSVLFSNWRTTRANRKLCFPSSRVSKLQTVHPSTSWHIQWEKIAKELSNLARSQGNLSETTSLSVKRP